MHAGAVIVGGYSPYGAVDVLTKAFLERLFSLRHQNGLNKGKLAVVVATCFTIMSIWEKTISLAFRCSCIFSFVETR